MTIAEAPEWVSDFLKVKAPWWLEGENKLAVTIIDENRKIAQVLREGRTYTLIAERFQIY